MNNKTIPISLQKEINTICDNPDEVKKLMTRLMDKSKIHKMDTGLNDLYDRDNTDNLRNTTFDYLKDK